MMVYIVMGHRYNEEALDFEDSIFGVYQDEEKAKLIAAQQEITDEMEGYLSNFFWVENWEVM